MSKELPYFKFNPSEWFEGDITLENERTQGLFVLICAWYWKKDCAVDLKFINKRLINGKASLKQCLQILIDKNIIKLNEDQTISILFLDEQYDELSEKRMKYVEAGRKGGQASLKHRRSIKDKEIDKEIDKDNIEERQKIFKEEIETFSDKYDIDMLTSFYAYWSETDRAKKKMKCEMQKTWETNRRLITWKNNNKKFSK